MTTSPNQLSTPGELGLRSVFSLPNIDENLDKFFDFDKVPNHFLAWQGIPFQYGKFNPNKQSMLNMQEYITTSPIQLNASFLNAADHSESHACHCGNSPIIYAYQGIPLNALPTKFVRGAKFKDIDPSKSNTWLMHLGFAWKIM